MLPIPAARQLVVGAMLSAGVLLAFTLTSSSASAHDGAHERIAELSRQIDGGADTAAHRLQRAEWLRRHGEFSAALADVAAAEALDPTAGPAHRLRADIALDRGCYIEALAHIDALLVADPDAGPVWRRRAEALTGLGELADAADAWDVALARLDPPEPDDYASRLTVILALGDVQRARAGLHEAEHRIGPVVALQLAAIEIDAGQGDLDRALARLDALAALSPSTERWHQRRGDLLAVAGRPDEAADAYRAGLTAIAGLPHRRRSTTAVASLARELADRLSHLPAATGASQP